jgi:hypothetical protein
LLKITLSSPNVSTAFRDDRSSNLLRRLRVEVGDHDLPAFRRDRAASRCADAAGSAGDDYNAVLYTSHRNPFRGSDR